MIWSASLMIQMVKDFSVSCYNSSRRAIYWSAVERWKKIGKSFQENFWCPRSRGEKAVNQASHGWWPTLFCIEQQNAEKLWSKNRWVKDSYLTLCSLYSMALPFRIYWPSRWRPMRQECLDHGPGQRIVQHNHDHLQEKLTNQIL